MLIIFRRELRDFGVSVHILEPGMFATNMMSSDRVAKHTRQKWMELSVEKQQQYGEKYIEKCK